MVEGSNPVCVFIHILLSNPLRLNPLRLNPLRLNSLRLNPLRLNPLRLNPLRRNPLRLNPLRLNQLFHIIISGRMGVFLRRRMYTLPQRRRARERAARFASALE